MAEEKKMPYEEAMMRWQYTLLICDWKRLVKVIASIAALLQVAIDNMKMKFDDARTDEMRVAYQDCIKMLENILAGNTDRIGDITSTYKNLISGENDFGQYCLAHWRKENMQLKSKIISLEVHVEALEKELKKKVRATETDED